MHDFFFLCYAIELQGSWPHPTLSDTFQEKYFGVVCRCGGGRGIGMLNRKHTLWCLHSCFMFLLF